MKNRPLAALVFAGLALAELGVYLQACSTCTRDVPTPAVDATPAPATDASPPRKVGFPFGPMGPVYASTIVEGIFGDGQSLLLGNSTNPISLSVPSSVMIHDSKGLFWLPNTVYPAGTYIWPNDPLDAGASFHKADGGACTSGNTVEPAWNRTNGTTTNDNTCDWVASTADAAIPYDWTNPDSGSLSLVDLSEPERPINTAIGGTGFSHGAYPNNILGEPPGAGLCAVYGAAMGVVCLAHTTGRANATYAEVKAGGSGNAYDAGLFEVTASPKLVTARYGSGYTYRVAALNWEQGEANCGDTPVTTSGNISSLQSTFETAAKGITGQTSSIPLVVTQVTSCGPLAANLPVSATSPGIFQGQLDAHNLYPGAVLMAGPKYDLEMAGDGAHLGNAGSYRRNGEKKGQALKTFKQTGTWSPLQPLTIVSALNDAGSAVITITESVPSGSLQFDANIPLYHQSGTFSDASQGGTGHGWTSGKGFELYTAAGAVQGIVSVSLSGSNQVIITANGSDVGFVGYAAMGDASAPCTGCNVRGGQLADQDPFVGPDQETFTCNVTNGSARVSGCPTSPIKKLDDARTLYDSVSGSGFAAGTVFKNRSGGVGTADMSNVWTGSTGTASLTFTHNMWNYGASFLVPISNPTGVSAFEFPAGTSNSQSRAACTGCLVGVKTWIANPSGGSIISLLTTSFISSSVLELTGIPSLSAGSYDLIVENPYNAQIRFSNAITATATDTVLSIAGLRAVGYFTGASAVQSGGLVSQVNDLSNRGNTFVDGAVSGHQVTYTASSANFNSQATWGCDGSGYLKNAAFNHAAALGNAIEWFGVAKITAPGTTSVAVQYNPTSYEWQVLSTGVNRWGTPSFATWGSATTGAAKFLRSGRDAGLAGTTHNAWFNVDNGTEVTASGLYSSMPTSAVAAICARSGGTLGVVSEWGALLWLNDKLTSAEEGRLYTVMKNEFGSGI